MAEFDNDTVAKAYARWAPIYDLVFGPVFDRGRKASIAAAERIGGRILEVGVGTGLSLPDYAWSNRLTGVDLSAPMLRKAKDRVAEHRLTNVDGLAVMDAQHLGFRGRRVRRGGRAIRHHRGARTRRRRSMNSCACCEPGGEIILVNHLGAETGPRASWKAGSRRSPVGWAGDPSSPGTGWRNGLPGTAACASSSAARCRRSVTSR